MFKFLREVATDARGNILKRELEDTLGMLNSGDARVSDQAELELVDIISDVMPKLHNMTAAGRTKLGRAYQAEARKVFDLDVARGMALWLMGAWLEALSLPTEEGVYVKRTIMRLMESIDMGNVRATFDGL